MKIIDFLKGVYYRMFPVSDIEKAFNIEILTDSEMFNAIAQAEQIYRNPPWIPHIKTVGMQRIVPSETARLAALELSISVSGSERADWINQQVQKFRKNLRHNIEYGLAFGGMTFKPNGNGVDYIPPSRFLPTETDGNGNITGAVFLDFIQRNDAIYTKAEYHHFKNNEYIIENKAFESNSKSILGMPVPLAKISEWSGIAPELRIQGLIQPLFSYFRPPNANNISIASPLGMAITADAYQQIYDLDVAYTRYADEIDDSQKVTIVDDSVLTDIDGKRLAEIPRYMLGLKFNGLDDVIKEINPTLQSSARIEGINHYLSIISMKCGFSDGYFVFNQKTGTIATATQVEADQQRTVQLIADVREQLKKAVDGLIYAIDKYADLYSLAPAGKYKTEYYFKDITQSFEADRLRFYNLAMANKYPWQMYYTKYEGYSEQEAKKIIEMIKSENPEPELFSGD
ncbi:MAG: hypothetical protein ACI4JM_05250 [Oscillospiraceae bacterium]